MSRSAGALCDAADKSQNMRRAGPAESVHRWLLECARMQCGPRPARLEWRLRRERCTRGPSTKKRSECVQRRVPQLKMPKDDRRERRCDTQIKSDARLGWRSNGGIHAGCSIFPRLKCREQEKAGRGAPATAGAANVCRSRVIRIALCYFRGVRSAQDEADGRSRAPSPCRKSEIRTFRQRRWVAVIASAERRERGGKHSNTERN